MLDRSGSTGRRLVVGLLLLVLAGEIGVIGYGRWRERPIDPCDVSSWSGAIAHGVPAERSSETDPALIGDIEAGPLYREDTVHPLSTSTRGRQLLYVGRLLDAAAIGQLMRDTAIDNLHPYLFDFRWGGGLMEAPWFSALAQGDALLLFTRLWQATGDDGWLKAARDTAATLRPNSPVTRIDEAGRLWLEEYPVEPPDGVINGHVGALLGLYAWWDATGEDGDVVTAGIRTAIARGADFLTRDGTIWYDERRTQTIYQAAYRDVYSWQYETLEAITGLTCLGQLADGFAAGRLTPAP